MKEGSLPPRQSQARKQGTAVPPPLLWPNSANAWTRNTMKPPELFIHLFLLKTKEPARLETRLCNEPRDPFCRCRFRDATTTTTTVPTTKHVYASIFPGCGSSLLSKATTATRSTATTRPTGKAKEQQHVEKNNNSSWLTLTIKNFGANDQKKTTEVLL